MLERIAANVRRLRVLRGWTQEQCAAQCGELDITVFRAIEAARTNVTAATTARLCDGLAVDVSELFQPGVVFERARPGRPTRHEKHGALGTDIKHSTKP